MLGLNQGLTWSTTLVTKIDLAGPAHRGLAVGLNEAAGHAAVAVTSLFAGHLAETHGLRPAPFLLGLAYAVLALGISTWGCLKPGTTLTWRLLKPTAPTLMPLFRCGPTRISSSTPASASQHCPPPARRGWSTTSTSDCPGACSPLLFATAELSLTQIGVLGALYPGVWGVGQLITGAASDRYGRKPFITSGMAIQAVGLVVIALRGFPDWAVGTVVLGAGTALVYPTMLAVVGDVARPAQRGRTVGVYRVRRDLGYAAGALLGGMVADLMGLHAAVWVAAVISAVSALVVAVRLYETHPRVHAVISA